jgi:lipoprotein Spr/probable lipoprotein NlpC
MLGRSLLLSFFLLFTGCSSKRSPQITSSSKIDEISYKPKSEDWITVALYKEYKKWYKTPYKLGGLGENGIDCSSLIQQIYKEAFGIHIPRTTKKQVQKGRKISIESAKAGDLVFFKTGYNKRHAGIIIEQGKFIHTSTKYGVTVSQLSNPYWRSNYWQSRRVLPE